VNRVEQLEKQIAELDSSELKQLRDWFDRHDAEMWDRQIEADVKAGKLTSLVERAEGRTTPL
jgi:hypothetical protein